MLPRYLLKNVQVMETPCFIIHYIRSMHSHAFPLGATQSVELYEPAGTDLRNSVRLVEAGSKWFILEHSSVVMMRVTRFF
jgi:hypothetical protein